jgi:hypothetical protein
MAIIFSSNDLLNIHPLTTVNGSIWYEIKTDNCPVRYMFTPETFIATKYANVIHIFNLKHDGIFPDEFKEYIKQIREKLNEFFFKKLLIGESISLWREINDNSHNFAIIRQTSSECKPFIDLSNAKKIVDQLNAVLQPFCPGFHLHIDYITSFPTDSVVSLYSDIPPNSYFQPQIILCLFTGNNCVSSITMNVTKSEITIDSRTNELYLERKFNTLLRAVAIIISKSLNEMAKMVVSIAVNATSALLMIKRFNAVLRDGDISSKTVQPEKLDQVVKDYIRQHALMQICVELNEVNIANATAVFHETIERMNCGPLKSGRIVFSSAALLNIRPLTTVNGNICYEIRESAECECPVKYVWTLESTTFIAIAMKYDDVIHIFNLKQNGNFPDEFKGYIERIKPKLYEYFKSGVGIGKAFMISDEINRRDNPYNFAIIRQVSSSCQCKPLIDLSNAQSIVHQLNAALQPTCPGFHLHIDYITSFPPDSVVSLYTDLFTNSYFQPQIVLCLFTGNNCVSSITIKVTESEMTIDSRTNKPYMERKFNTLLRAVAIIISKSLNERAKRLVSSAENVISALLMIKRFNAVPRNGTISSKTVPPETLAKVIKEYFDHMGGMETCVELNEENIANATTVFHETIQRMNCGPLVDASAKGGKRKYTRKVIKKSKKHIKRSNKHNKY